MKFDNFNKNDLNEFLDKTAKQIGSYQDNELTIQYSEYMQTFDKDWPDVKVKGYEYTFRSIKDLFEKAEYMDKVLSKKNDEYLDSPITRREFEQLMKKRGL